MVSKSIIPLRVTSVLILLHSIKSFQPSFLPISPSRGESQLEVASSREKTSGATQDTSQDDVLTYYQERGTAILKKFHPSKYNPHPLLANKHLQTILGVFIRDEEGCAYINSNENVFNQMMPVLKGVKTKLPNILGESNEDNCDFWDEREKVLIDDDFFHVDYKYADMNKSSRGLVVLVHGLESNSNSSLSTNMARAYQHYNFDVACLNFRGCSGVPSDSIYQYHGGFTDDIKHFIKLSSERQKDQPLYLSGFSLGTNIVMRCLGELGLDAAEKYNIRGAALLGVPFELEPHYRKLIDDPFNRIVYAGTILKSMKSKVNYLIERFCGGDKDTNMINYWECMNATTIAEIEDNWIAPLYGFEDKFDYFRQTSSIPVMNRIAVPTFALNAVE